MKVYLMNTNAGRSIVINNNNEWYYRAYSNSCNRHFGSIHRTIKNLYKHVNKIYNSGDTISINKFKHLKQYDGTNIWEFIESIHDYEIEQGIPHIEQTVYEV